MTQQQINLTVRVFFSLLLIFILMNIDYSLNYRTYTLIPKAPTPQIEIINEGKDKKTIKMNRCMYQAGKLGYYINTNQEQNSNNLKFTTLIRDSIDQKHAIIEISKNKDVKISLSCESSLIPMRWTNYHF